MSYNNKNEKDMICDIPLTYFSTQTRPATCLQDLNPITVLQPPFRFIPYVFLKTKPNKKIT